ncbi:MAG TPA: agmatine deiminase family protein [Desulfitobacteriaceae bacterium]|nr:agmatine deiminase family protein [Desulfitobacteriaceae bacterium]
MNPEILNYKMPAEWAAHARTFISWPVRESMCYPENYETVCQGYADIILAIAEFEPVTVVVNPADVAILSSYFEKGTIEYLSLPHNDSWLRDNGPTFLVNEAGEVAGVNWRFNAWGGKYPPWDLDDQTAPQLLSQLGLKCFDAPLVLEGGSIHVDGEGTLLTTEECLLNNNRNPELSRDEIEKDLQKFLHVQKVIWLKNGLYGDETDGHVDNIACFAAPGKILMQVCHDPSDENYAITRTNMEILNKARDARDRKIEIIPIQQPPRQEYNKKRLTLSYINYYFVNQGIILPVFGGEAEETDRLAVEKLQAIFPARRVRTVNGMKIITEGGNVHCLTQQLPLSQV